MMSNVSARHSCFQIITANPGISASSHWAVIETQKIQLKPSSISIRYNPGPHSFVGTTDNVQAISFDRTLRYVRYIGTITGTSPSFPLAVIVGEQKKQV